MKKKGDASSPGGEVAFSSILDAPKKRVSITLSSENLETKLATNAKALSQKLVAAKKRERDRPPALANRYPDRYPPAVSNGVYTNGDFGEFSAPSPPGSID